MTAQLVSPSFIIAAVIFIGMMTLILALISLLSRHIHRILKNILESYNIYDREEVMRAKNLSALAVLMNICVYVYSRIDIRINIFIVWGILALAVTAAINWQEIDRGLYVSQFKDR